MSNWVVVVFKIVPLYLRGTKWPFRQHTLYTYRLLCYSLANEHGVCMCACVCVCARALNVYSFSIPFVFSFGIPIQCIKFIVFYSIRGCGNHVMSFRRTVNVFHELFLLE